MKVKVIFGYNQTDYEKEINEFIIGKKVHQISHAMAAGSGMYYCYSCTILYEE